MDSPALRADEILCLQCRVGLEATTNVIYRSHVATAKEGYGGANMRDTELKAKLLELRMFRAMVMAMRRGGMYCGLAWLVQRGLFR